MRQCLGGIEWREEMENLRVEEAWQLIKNKLHEVPMSPGAHEKEAECQSSALDGW